jgi:hypothetical protein
MSLSYKCPECETEMALAESTHVCPNEECGKTLSIDEATEMFEKGELIGVVEESEVEEISEDKKDEIVIADISEDVSALVKGEDLSEEFVEKAAVIMESAIKARVAAEVSRIEEEKETAISEGIESAKQDLIEKIDEYLDHVVTKWVEENRIAIESGVKAEMNESFVEGLAGLLKEHYVKVPEERWDIVEGLAEKVESLESKLDEAIEENISLKAAKFESEKKMKFAEISEDLAETQKEKLAELAEGVEAKDIEEYVSKVETIKESYFSSKSDSKEESLDEEVVDEDVDSVESSANELLKEAIRLLNKKN